jgi:hypothetical protein
VTSHLFLDETKQRGYAFVVVSLSVGEMKTARRAIRELVLPGQRRLHMKDERDARKRLIASTVVDLGVRAVVVDAGRRYNTDVERRERCLEAVVKCASRSRPATLTLELDETSMQRDRQVLYAATRAHGFPELRYEHRRGSEEQLLAIPDAIAWCWAKGGVWRRRIEEVILEVREV